MEQQAGVADTYPLTVVGGALGTPHGRLQAGPVAAKVAGGVHLVLQDLKLGCVHLGPLQQQHEAMPVSIQFHSGWSWGVGVGWGVQHSPRSVLGERVQERSIFIFMIMHSVIYLHPSLSLSCFLSSQHHKTAVLTLCCWNVICKPRFFFLLDYQKR